MTHSASLAQNAPNTLCGTSIDRYSAVPVLDVFWFGPIDILILAVPVANRLQDFEKLVEFFLIIAPEVDGPGIHGLPHLL